MIILIGTGHVFDLAQALLSVFDEEEPDCICVELDRQRYHQLLLKKQGGERVNKPQRNLPLLYQLLARFQENMAEKYGVVPGDEMLTAISYAQNHQLPLHLIDMDAQSVFSTLLSQMTVKEKLRFVFSSVMGLFITKEKVERELDSIQENFDSYLDEIGKKFPTIKEVLIDKRNRYMVDNLLRLNEDYERVIACVGDGHVQGMTEMFEESLVETRSIRLATLQHKTESHVNGSSASFHVSYSE
jgi:pheromone shutdown-related protein TraB